MHCEENRERKVRDIFLCLLQYTHPHTAACGAVIVAHAALQHMVKNACSDSRVAPYQLGAVGLTRGNFVDAAARRLGSDSPRDARDQSSTTYQAATVSRGDDVRPRRLHELGWHFLVNNNKP